MEAEYDLSKMQARKSPYRAAGAERQKAGEVSMKAKDFDKKFDDDQEDVVSDLDLSSARRPNMSVDTAITHVTRAGANIFSELGFGEEEAHQLHEQARAQIKILQTPRPSEPSTKREHQ